MCCPAWTLYIAILLFHGKASACLCTSRLHTYSCTHQSHINMCTFSSPEAPVSNHCTYTQTQYGVESAPICTLYIYFFWPLQSTQTCGSDEEIRRMPYDDYKIRARRMLKKIFASCFVHTEWGSHVRWIEALRLFGTLVLWAWEVGSDCCNCAWLRNNSKSKVIGSSSSSSSRAPFVIASSRRNAQNATIWLYSRLASLAWHSSGVLTTKATTIWQEETLVRRGNGWSGSNDSMGYVLVKGYHIDYSVAYSASICVLISS